MSISYRQLIVVAIFLLGNHTLAIALHSALSFFCDAYHCSQKLYIHDPITEGPKGVFNSDANSKV